MIACLASSPNVSALSAIKAATASVNIFLSNEVASRMRRTYALNRTEWFPLQTTEHCWRTRAAAFSISFCLKQMLGPPSMLLSETSFGPRSRISPYSHPFAFLISQQAAAHNPLLVDVEVGCQTKPRVSWYSGRHSSQAPRMHAAVSAQGPSSPRKMTGASARDGEA